MATIETDNVVALMRAAGVAITREAWIDCAYGSEIPDPWTFEDEAQVPEELQDWDAVQADDAGPEDDEPEDEDEEVAF
jgi:hypothetical protein